MKLFFIVATLALFRCSHAVVATVVTSREPITCDGFACEVCHNGGYCIPVPLNGYICKCPGNFTGPRCDVCLIKPDWFDGGNGYQYWKTPTKMTYENAQVECDKHGAQLAIHGFRNPTFQRKLATHFEPEVLWIGLTDRAIEGTFIWSDGIELSSAWFYWGSPVPQSDDSADCVAIANSTDVGLSFNAFNCSMEFEGYCEAPIGSPVLAPLYETSMGLTYTIIPPAVYETSELLCERLGGNLAVLAVNHGEMLRKVLNHFQETGYIGSSNVFLGFEDVITEGQFMSRSGISLSTPLFWNVANPGPNTANDNCLTATPEYSAWLDDKNCSLLLPGLCEIGSQNFLSERECKSGKMCPPFSVCAVNDATCFEECICMEGYAGFSQPTLGFSCKYDMCHNNKITCGGNSFCTVVDELTFEQDCVCEDGFFAIGNIHTDGCVELCNGVNCGVDAYCVYNPLEGIEECRCKPGYAPDDSPVEGCFYDLCAGGNITCGENAKCCILDESTKLQGCRCDDGFVPKADPEIGCVAPCANIVCGANASCVAETNSTVGHCECNGGNLPNTTAEEGCFYDLCYNNEIMCGANSFCTVVDELTSEQDCVCGDGFFAIGNIHTDGCVELCNSVNCGVDAYCVYNPLEEIEECRCKPGYAPDDSPVEGCFYDLCAGGNITCGENAKCCILDESTKLQGCRCDDGFVPKADPEIGCIAPCANIVCGANASCVAETNSTVGHCECNGGNLPNTTAEDGCFYDQCGNRNIVCGSFAICAVIDTVTQQQGCICYDGFLPNTTAEEGCVDPCDGVTCGSNARCVVDPNKVIGHCECNSGFLPNNTAADGCFYDECADQTITCGVSALCVVLDNVTKIQGCICRTGFVPNPIPEQGCVDPCANVTCGPNSNCAFIEGSATGHCQCINGFLPSSNASEGCFHDECASGDIVCGPNALCGLLCEKTKLQGCTCFDGYLANKTAANGCYYDKCGNGEIECGPNARCGLMCDISLQQGCICFNGFVPNGTAEVEGCIAPKDCTQLTAFDIYFASLGVNDTYSTEIYGAIFDGIKSDFRSTSGFSEFASLDGANGQLTSLNPNTTREPEYIAGTPFVTAISDMIMGQSSNNRLDAMNIVIIAGVPESEILWPPSNLQTLGTIPILNIIHLIPDTLTPEEVPARILSIENEICQWVLDGYPDLYA